MESIKKYNEPIYGNYIHPTAIIGDYVEIGKYNYIGPYCIIRDNTIIGDGNRFESHCVVNSIPEHKSYFISGTSFGTVIGNNNTIREFTTINAGTEQDTVIGNDNIMLRGSHCGHDVIIENNVTISCNVLLGGHSHVMEGANMALGSICHQYSVIGSYAMVGMGGIVTKSTKIEPGGIYVGNPVKFLKENQIGLERAGVTDVKLQDYYKKYKILLDK